MTLAPQWGVVQNSFPTVENQLNGPGLNMVVTLASTLPRGFANLLSASYEVEHISLAPQPGVGVTSLSRPAILDNPASVGGTPIPGSSLCSQVAGVGGQLTNQCPMGYIFSNGFGGNKLPGLVFQGNNGAYGGHGFAADTGYAPWNQANPTFNLRDDVSKTIGKHTLQFGFEGTFVQQNEVSGVTGANSGGSTRLAYLQRPAIHPHYWQRFRRFSERICDQELHRTAVRRSITTVTKLPTSIFRTIGVQHPVDHQPSDFVAVSSVPGITPRTRPTTGGPRHSINRSARPFISTRITAILCRKVVARRCHSTEADLTASPRSGPIVDEWPDAVWRERVSR